jgi:ABC-2 type transport system permease protein
MTTTAKHEAAVPSSTGLSFPRLVRSEWVKFRSIRSTWWCSAIIVVVTIGMAALLGRFVGDDGNVPQQAVDGQFVSINTASVSLTALVVGVLGVLIVSGEYATGQIRSTFTADPRRIGAVLAKAVVLAVSTFVVSFVATWIGVAVSYAFQAAGGLHPAVSDPAVAMPLLGASVYSSLLALLAFGIGLVVRSSAGGIAITLGILLVLPVILSLVGGLLDAQWATDVIQFLPSQAGGQLHTYDFPGLTPSEGVTLNGWGGFSVLLAEVVVVGAVALSLVRSRDV